MLKGEYAPYTGVLVPEDNYRQFTKDSLSNNKLMIRLMECKSENVELKQASECPSNFVRDLKSFGIGSIIGIVITLLIKK